MIQQEQEFITMTENRREQKLRERAKKLDLIASKRVPPYFSATPGWMIIDSRTNAALAGTENGHAYSLTLEQAEAFISEMEKNADE
jgi:hypothetical protein